MNASSPRILALVGMSGVGKSEAVAAFERLGAFRRVYFGGLVLGEVERRGLAISEDAEGRVAKELRDEHGMAAMAVLSERPIDEALAAGSDVLIDGLYSTAELTHLRARYGDQLTLVAVHASKALRKARLAARPERALTPEEVEARDWREITELDKAGPIALADHHIVNDAGLAELEAAVRAVYAVVFDAA